MQGERERTLIDFLHAQRFNIKHFCHGLLLPIVLIATIMKSTKVLNPRRIPLSYIANNERLLATPRDVAVFPGQFSLPRGLAASVC